MAQLRRGATICLLILWGMAILACSGTGNNNKRSEGKADAKYKIGDEISFEDSTWVVMDSKDMGKTLQSNNQFQKAASTDGKFVVVHFKVTNLGKKEQRLINTPKLIDAEGREFKHYDKQAFYIPKNAKTMTMEALPSGLTREFYHVYEVPANVKGLKFQTRDLSSTFSPDYKLVELSF